MNETILSNRRPIISKDNTSDTQLPGELLKKQPTVFLGKEDRSRQVISKSLANGNNLLSYQRR